ncbi:MAG: hypothetical protein KAI47_12940 [Deltaproteobacteria bacterium]|nr:hypothetical protein [Deltaproteobacteria bacterium]
MDKEEIKGSTDDLKVELSRLERQANAFMASRIVMLGVELGIYDRLVRGDADAGTLADDLETTQRGMEIVCDALVSLAWLDKHDGKYALKPAAAAFLVDGEPESRVSIMKHRAEMFRAWAVLEQIVRVGSLVTEGEKATLTDPATNRNFILGMAEVSRGRLGPIVDRLPLDGARRFVDVGGGPAQYAIEIARRNPTLQATVVDLPLTVEVAKECIADAGLSDRVDTVVCDFYASETVDLGGEADVVLISQVFHAEGAVENAALITKISVSLRRGGWIAVVDNMIDEDGTSPPAAALFAVNMLAGTERGRTYTEKEIAGWLKSAGLEVEPLIEIGPRTQMILARKPV